MAQILPAEFNLGGEIGKSMRSGVSSALNTLAQYKLQDVMQRQQGNKYRDAYKKLGIPEDIADLPEHIQQRYLQSYLETNPELLDKMKSAGYSQQGEPIANQQQQAMDPMQQQRQQQDQQMMGQLGQAFQRPQGPQNASDMMANAMQSQLGMQQPQSQGMGQGTQILQGMQERQQPQMQQQPTQDPPAQAMLQLVKPPKTPRELGYNINIPKQREAYHKHLEAQQRRIDTKSKPFLTKLTKQFDLDSEIVDEATEALRLLDTNKTRSGMMGLLPAEYSFANKETRNLNTIYNSLASKKALEGAGVMSQAKIKLAKSTKPELNMPIESQRYVLNRILKQAQERGIALNEISQEIIEQNDGKTPEGLENLVYKEYKRRYPHNVKGTGVESKEVPQVGAIADSLAEFKDYPEGTEIKGDKGVTYLKTANGWRKQ